MPLGFSRGGPRIIHRQVENYAHWGAVHATGEGAKKKTCNQQNCAAGCTLFVFVAGREGLVAQHVVRLLENGLGTGDTAAGGLWRVEGGVLQGLIDDGTIGIDIVDAHARAIGQHDA